MIDNNKIKLKIIVVFLVIVIFILIGELYYLQKHIQLLNSYIENMDIFMDEMKRRQEPNEQEKQKGGSLRTWLLIVATCLLAWINT